MPCAGPSEAELRAMECKENHRRYGKKWTTDELIENVACAYTAFVRHGTPLPDYAVKWSDAHEEYDRKRKQEEKNRREAEEQKEYEQYLALRRKFGKK